MFLTSICAFRIITFGLLISYSTCFAESNDSFIRKQQRALNLLQDKLRKLNGKKSKKPSATLLIANIKNLKTAIYVLHFNLKVKTVAENNFPKEAVDKKLSGVALINTVLNKNGTVLRIHVVTSSGHKILDEAAKKYIRLASPFKKVPNVVMENKDELHVVWRYNFSLTQE